MSREDIEAEVELTFWQWMLLWIAISVVGNCAWRATSALSRIADAQERAHPVSVSK